MKRIYLKLTTLMTAFVILTSMSFTAFADDAPTYLDLSANKTVFLKDESVDIKIYSVDYSGTASSPTLLTDDTQFTYRSSEPNFTVSGEGLLTAVSEGCSVITVIHNESGVKNSFVATCYGTDYGAGSGTWEVKQNTADPAGIESRNVWINTNGSGSYVMSNNKGVDSKVMVMWFYDADTAKDISLEIRSCYNKNVDNSSRLYLKNSSGNYVITSNTTIYAEASGYAKESAKRSKGWHQLLFLQEKESDASLPLRIYIDGKYAYNTTADRFPWMIFPRGVYFHGFECVSYANGASLEIDNATEGEEIDVSDFVEVKFSGNIVKSENADDMLLLTDSEGNKIEVTADAAADDKTIRVKPAYPLSAGTEYKYTLGEIVGSASGINSAPKLLSSPTYTFKTKYAPIYVKSLTGSSDGQFKADAEIINNTGSEGTLWLIMTVYDKNGAVKKSYAKKCDLTSSSMSQNFSIQSDLESIEGLCAEVYVTDSITAKEASSYSKTLQIGNKKVTETAEASDEYKILASLNPESGILSVTGRSKTNRANLPVTVRLINPKVDDPNTDENEALTPMDYTAATQSTFSDIYARIEQTKTAAGGKFGYGFSMDGYRNGTYRVIVNMPYEDEAYDVELHYVSLETVLQTLSDVNKADSSNIAERLENAILNFTFDRSDYSKLSNKTYVYTYILDKKGSDENYYKTTDDLKKDYLEGVAKAREIENDTENYLENNKAALKISSLKSYEYFKDAGKTVKENIIGKIKLVNRDSEIAAALNDNIVYETLCSFKNYSQVYKLIEDFTKAGLLTANTSKYSSLDYENKALVQTKLLDEASSLTTNKLISEKFNELVKKYTPSGSSSSLGKVTDKKTTVSNSALSNPGTVGGTLVADPEEGEEFKLPDWVLEEREAQAKAEQVFADLSQAEWAKESIKDLYTKNIVSGYPDGTFGVNNYITREEIVKLLVLAGGLQSNNGEAESFFDVSEDAWYFEYIKIAVENGIVNGVGNNMFGVGQPITREEMAAMLYRLCEATGVLLDEELTIFPFKDQGDISDWANYPVKVLRESFLISGYEGNVFMPKDNLTRAQAAKMIYGYVHYND